jgi:hypothetical protein
VTSLIKKKEKGEVIPAIKISLQLNKKLDLKNHVAI